MNLRTPAFAARLAIALLPSMALPQMVPPPQLEPIGPPLFVVTVKGKDGFIDREGKLAIAPDFEKACPFADGLAAVQKQGAWGFIDTKGRMAIAPQFVSVGMFSDGLAEFQRQRFADRSGYIDKTGKAVVKAQFDCAEPFRNGIARVGFVSPKNRLLSLVADVGLICDHQFIDRTGKFVPEPSPTHYATGAPGELIPFRKNGLAGYVDAKGEVAIPPQFQAAGPFSEGLASACKEDALMGYIDQRGAWAIPPRFKYATNFSEGLAGVPLEEGKWGFIDRTGKVAIPAKFAWVMTGFRHGVAEVVFDRKRGYIDKKGEWIWPPSD